MQIVRYSAGEDGFKADVSYEELSDVASGSGSRSTGSAQKQSSSLPSIVSPAVPVVLVRSPHSRSYPSTTDKLFISELPQPGVINSKRNISPVLPATSNHDHNRHPYFLNDNFHAIETAHYIIPKPPPRAARASIKSFAKPSNDNNYASPRYTTNFLNQNKDAQSLPPQHKNKPVRFPITSRTQSIVDKGVQATTESPSFRSSTSPISSSTPSLSGTTLPPLLPAFHPDYNPPKSVELDTELQSHLHLEQVTEEEIKSTTERRSGLGNVPRFKHSVIYQPTTTDLSDNDLLPAFHPQFKLRQQNQKTGNSSQKSRNFINYVTPLPYSKFDYQVNRERKHFKTEIHSVSLLDTIQAC